MPHTKIYLSDALENIWEQIKNKHNITLLRYGDGERAIIQGRAVNAQEGWRGPNHRTELSEALESTLCFDDPQIHYGISCPCCDKEAYYWYSSRIKNGNKTFSNMFANGNYTELIKKIETLQRDAIIIGNSVGLGKKIANLTILKYYSIGDDCISFWESDAKVLLEQIKKEYGHKKDLLYVVCAGPLSEPMIMSLFQNNPDNCYIDFGSSLDKYIHGSITRSYQKAKSKYKTKNCWMWNPEKTSFDVSVIVNLYKRPENLEMQLKALENQNLKPKEIMIFQDPVNSGPPIPFPNELKERFDVIEISSKNVGVWGRFNFSEKASSPYVCVFDDDTIPGSRWLENCHTEMQKQEGLYGTNGVLMMDPPTYPKNFISIGWKNPNKTTVEVDFVGHAWFFKKKWLPYLFMAPQSIQDLKICGEDMSFSYELLKHLNIKTYIPPHPGRKVEFYGSIPKHGRRLGGSAAALSQSKESRQNYKKAMNILVDKGWVTVLQKNKKWHLLLARYLHPLIKTLCGLILLQGPRRRARGALLHRILPK